MFNILINFAKEIKPIGFSGLSIYDVTLFFWKGLIEGAITTRASSLAFNFFLAFFPSIVGISIIVPRAASVIEIGNSKNRFTSDLLNSS